MRKRKPLTITLSPQTLGKVDSIIDGSSVRNRSDAIEQLIEKGFSKSVDTAVILAGGTSITHTSQILKKINGRYLLDIMIAQLKKYHFKKIIICSGSKIDQIKKVFQDGSERGMQIEYVQEKKVMGTAGALKLAEDKINSKNFLVIYGDILTKMNFESFIEFHFAEGRLATMGVKPRMGEKKYGRVMIEGNSVVSYAHQRTNVGISLVNTGLFVFSDQIFQYIKPGVQAYLGKDVLPQLIAKDQLSAFVFQGIWYDISAAEDFKEAQEKWS